MSNETHDTAAHHPNYVAVFIALMALFLVSVGVAFLGATKLAAVGIFAVAFAKAALVILFFMHLKSEPKWIAAIFAFCIFFVVAMFVGMIPDMVYVYGG